MGQKIVIVDYNMGNISSVYKKILRLGTEPLVSNDISHIAGADKLILPGVGHFKKAMENLKTLSLIETLNETVLVKKKIVLGICLGMQLFSKSSEEGNVPGLGWVDGEVVRFKISDKTKFKVPHMGWNRIVSKKESPLMANIPESSEFYFVHSYYFNCNHKEDILQETTYEYPFTSAICKENIFGVQYHPEKSHDIGEQLLKNFMLL